MAFDGILNGENFIFFKPNF